MISPEYQALFPESKLNDKNIATTAQSNYLRNSEVFEIVGHTGRYFCAGVGGGISGQPMLYGNIDDALKGRQDAESKTVRDSIWNWYNGDFYTRQGKDARILITATRWNEEDLPGKLLKLQASDNRSDKWTVVSLPAIAEDPIAPYDPRQPGDPLWEDRYPLSHLEKVRAMSEYDWASLYQQRPHNDAFSLFNTELMHLIEPQTVDLKKCKFYGALDPSQGGSDYAAIITVALTPEGNWLVWDCDLSYDAQSKSLLKIIQKHQQFKYTSFVIESNSLGHAKSAPGDSLFILELKKEQAKQRVAIPYVLEWHTKNKIDRIRSLQPYFANGTLAFRSDWVNVYPEFINQMRLVPDPSAHDDGPDVLEMAIDTLLKMNRKANAINYSNIRGDSVRPGWQAADPDEEEY
jgi:predicted phage terminase large subunit-like protein